MLLGYHLLWSTTANVVGTDEQQESVQEVIIRNNFFVGGAVNPRDNDLKITDDGNEIVFHGSKNFNTGGWFTSVLCIDFFFLSFLFFIFADYVSIFDEFAGVVSDLTVLEGVLDGTEDHIFTLVKTDQPGIQFAHNW